MINRRNILIGSAASVAALSMPRMAFAAEQADVVVIGAGLSGLHAAELLVDLGMKVVVLEANNEAGGRTKTVATADGPIDVGASQIGRGYARILDACQRYGMELIPEDRDILTFGGYLNGQWYDPKTWETNPMNNLVGDERKLSPLLFGTQLAAKHNPLKEIEDWLDPKFSKFDISMRQLMQRRKYSPEAIKLAALTVPGISIDGTSMLRIWQEEMRGHLDRQMNAAAEKLQQAKSNEPGYRNSKVINGLAHISNVNGGMQKLPLAMAAKLGDAVRLNKKVVGITMKANGATVTCADGTAVSAKFVVATVPFSVFRKVKITATKESPLHRRAINSMPYANTARLYLTVERPFWKEDGLPASFSSDSPIGMFWGIDNHSGVGAHKAMVVMVGPFATAIAKMPQAEAEAFIMKELERLRPASKGLLRLNTYKDWERDPNQLGCGFSVGPGHVNSYARDMVKPWQVMHFAGEHMRRLEYGMEAAMESGERAALDISALA